MAQNQLLLSRARSAVIARDFNLAVRLYKQLLRDDRDNIQLLNHLGNLYMKAGKDDQALGVFKRISELDRENCDPLITMGGIYRRLKRYEESIAALEQALVLDGDNAQISYNLGFTYKIMGDNENAISCFEDAIEMNPDDVLAYNHLGAIYAAKGEHEKAVQSYQRGLNVDANHPVLLLNLAKSYESLGEYEKACSAYSGALRSRPLWIDAIDGYSRLLISIQKAREAYNLVTRAIAVNPKDQKLKDALENVKKHLDDIPQNAEPSNQGDKLDVPPFFDGDSEVATGEEEFESHGAEIHMEDAQQFSEIEDAELNEPDIPANDIKETKEDDYSSPFDFDSMGMDDLANDGPLDPLVFQKADDADNFGVEPEQNLDDLIKNDEAPLDTEESPIENSGVFDDFEDDNFYDMGEDNQDQISLDDGSALPQENSPKNLDLPAENDEVSENLQEIEKLKDDLKFQVEKAEFAVDKANFAAEKALDAAQQAEESVQLLEDNKEEFDGTDELLKQNENEPEEVPQAEEDSGEEEELEPQEEDFGEEEELEPQAEESDILFLTENDKEEADTVEIEDFDDNKSLITDDKNEDERLSLFVKLRELLEYLPQEKKAEFETSEIRLKMDYVISRLSGEKGLLEKINELIQSGSVMPCESYQETSEDNLLQNGVSILKELVACLPDDTMKQAMENQLEKIV